MQVHKKKSDDRNPLRRRMKYRTNRRKKAILAAICLCAAVIIVSAVVIHSKSSREPVEADTSMTAVATSVADTPLTASSVLPSDDSTESDSRNSIRRFAVLIAVFFTPNHSVLHPESDFFCAVWISARKKSGSLRPRIFFCAHHSMTAFGDQINHLANISHG